LAHRCHGFPIHDVAHELSLHHSSVLADDRYAVLHRGHSDDHLCVNELHRHDAVHLTADALDDHRNCVRDLDGRHHHVDDLDANRDHRNGHQMMDDPNLDDHGLLDDHHRYADVMDDLGDHRNDLALVDDHHRCADATDDLNQNCVRDLDGRHHHVDDLDANHDLQTCRQLMDVQMMDDPNLDDPMTDDRDRLDDHLHCADATDDLNQNCVDDLDDRRCCVGATDGHHHCADDLDDHLHYEDVPDGHHHCVVEKVVNRHDEGLWLQRHLGVLDGLNHYLVLGDGDRFCLV
jgi:hypothetical protein